MKKIVSTPAWIVLPMLSFLVSCGNQTISGMENVEAQSLAEQEYHQAKALEDQQQYLASLSKYQDYLSKNPVSANVQRASVKLPVLAEGDLYGDGDDFNQFLQAMNSRDEGDTDRALEILNEMINEPPGSYLADDALYLKGYIELIDNGNYEQARQSMTTLMEKYPVSTYYDSALYSIALSHEEAGETVEAGVRYLELMARHRSPVWSKIKLRIASDNYLSRLWFNRANLGLDRIKA